MIIVLLLLFLVRFAGAQKPAFFRVYNAEGKKVNKGTLYEFSDTSVTLTRRNQFVETHLSQIDVIKSKRTTGHRVMKTTLIVMGAAVFLVAAVYALSRGGPGYGNIIPALINLNPWAIKIQWENPQGRKKNIR